MDEQITISASEYKRLKNDSLHLQFLMARGVDNWDGYRSLPDREDFETEAEWLKAIAAAQNNW